jgi:coenzyme F420-reducing hydrogenase delta subunit
VPEVASGVLVHEAGSRLLAKVLPDLCASCGICAGSCPSSTPFRTVTKLVTGIDMPQLPIDGLRKALRTKLAAIAGDTKIVVFGCDRGAAVDALAGPDVAGFSLICTGMLPPAFVEYALREGASGVLVTGCRETGCAFRLGSRWTEQRLLGMREPHLRTGASRERLCIAWADRGEESELRDSLLEFRHRLEALPEVPAEYLEDISPTGTSHAQI